MHSKMRSLPNVFSSVLLANIITAGGRRLVAHRKATAWEQGHPRSITCDWLCFLRSSLAALRPPQARRIVTATLNTVQWHAGQIISEVTSKFAVQANDNSEGTVDLLECMGNGPMDQTKKGMKSAWDAIDWLPARNSVRLLVPCGRAPATARFAAPAPHTAGCHLTVWVIQTAFE